MSLSMGEATSSTSQEANTHEKALPSSSSFGDLNALSEEDQIALAMYLNLDSTADSAHSPTLQPPALSVRRRKKCVLM